MTCAGRCRAEKTFRARPGRSITASVAPRSADAVPAPSAASWTRRSAPTRRVARTCRAADDRLPPDPLIKLQIAHGWQASERDCSRYNPALGTFRVIELIARTEARAHSGAKDERRAGCRRFPQ